eukprot:gnl/TRDRNA2_/TRDRNA2_160863_c0_seq1.p1 gnl/TRDRNA2_/TRDRNA2_160863_c0~~gnl/TRDRNA2_/TRDRNA2_160863_c0_seq1.p1  ORF type:complete len:111 (+),score=10.98 gnl/TRDRNA2_/TRDRNA2_160863_c0_seq1:161-493(+)
MAQPGKHFIAMLRSPVSSWRHWFSHSREGRQYMYEVFRIDTHGNHFPVKVFADREEAQRLADEYEAKGHHQGYFVRQIPNCRMPDPLPTGLTHSKDMRASIAKWRSGCTE